MDRINTVILLNELLKELKDNKNYKLYSEAIKVAISYLNAIEEIRNEL